MIRLLIIDFDGTLHPYGAPVTSANAGQPAQLCYLPALEAILREFPDVEVVIASAWRNHHTLDDAGILLCRSSGTHHRSDGAG